MATEYKLSYTAAEIDERLGDVKDNMDRLTAIEYQTVVTDEAYEHKNLPEGEKTVTINGDGSWGDVAYINYGIDYSPKGGFKQTMPYEGIAIEKRGLGYYISGTSGENLLTVAFNYSTGNIYFPVTSEMLGKRMRLISFSEKVTGYAFNFKVRFYNANTSLSESIGGTSVTIGRDTQVTVSAFDVPNTATHYVFTLGIGANRVYDQSFAVYLVDYEQTSRINLTDNSAQIQTSATDFATLPYLSTATMTLGLSAYINYSGGSTSCLTPEMFGAKGDGITDDSNAIEKCLKTASEKHQVVLMPNQYYTTSPIVISQNGLDVICNDIIYIGTDCAVKIQGQTNNIKIHSITSSGIGIGFFSNETQRTMHNNIDINTINSKSHGIAFYYGESIIFQNTIRFNYISAGGTSCYGICYIGEGTANIDENNFFGGQISNCEWAVYNVGGNSRCYNFEVEENVEGGFCTHRGGGLLVFYPRSAESQRDGNLPFYKFIGTQNVFIYGSSPMPISEFDLSEAIDTFENASGNIYSVFESRISVYNGIITAKPHAEGENVQRPTAYTTKAYLWGKYLIMTPHMSYVESVTEAEFDTRDIGNPDKSQVAFTQLPTKFVVDTINTKIYLHPSYCAFGFKEFEVEQANGFTCEIYGLQKNEDENGSFVEEDVLIFDGTTHGNGTFKFKAYKDAEYCYENSSGLLRADFLGHYWEITKQEVIATDDGAGNVTLTTEVISV